MVEPFWVVQSGSADQYSLAKAGGLAVCLYAGRHFIAAMGKRAGRVVF